MSAWAEAAGSNPVAQQRSTDRTNWRNFLDKYSEANRLHTTALDFALQNTDDHLLRAQCNCAYWHGVFGGVYLPHLRSALWEELARSRAQAVNSVPVVQTEQAVYLSNKGLCLRCTPSSGGMLDTILQYDPPFNWGCTLTRRPEAYHEKLRRAATVPPRGPRSVHSRREVRRGNFKGLLMYDTYERASLLDHFFKSTGLISRFATGELDESGDFIDQPYELTESDGAVTLTRDGVVRVGGRITRVQIAKAIRLTDDHTFEVKYNVNAHGELEGRFGVEWNLTALAPTGPNRWVEVNGDQGGEPRSRKRYSDVNQFGLVDGWGRKAIRIDTSPNCDLWRFGLHTVSQSERSFEQVYQQTVFMAHWPLQGLKSLEAVFSVQLQHI
jgi:alpha-amylase